MNEAKYTTNNGNEIPSGDSHRTLDDLFADARSEANYLDNEYTRRSLLEQAVDRNSIKSYSPVRSWTLRYGPNFNIGAIIMTSLSLSAAAILAISFLSSSPQPSTYSAADANQTAIQKHREHLPFESITRTPSASIQTGLVHWIPLHSGTPPVGGGLAALQHDTELFAPVDVEGIKPVTPTQEQVEQLGIDLAPNGNITYCFRSSYNDKPVTHIFMPNAGTKLAIDDTDAGMNASLLPSSSVRMITNVDGAKRFFHFEEHHFIPFHNLQKFGINDSALSGEIRSSITMDGDVPDSALIQKIIHVVKEVRTNYGNDAVPNDLNIAKDESDVDIPGMSRGSIDSTIRRIHRIMLQKVTLNIDSSYNDENLDEELHTQSSLSPNQRKKVEIRINSNSDLPSLGISQPDMEQILKQSIDSATLGKLCLTLVKDTKMLVSSDMDQVALHQPDVNKLVPVLIKNLYNPAKQNALIFWYDPTPELTAILGVTPPIAAVNSEKDTKALREIEVFPNPATTNTTVRFTLGDARSVSFAIYSLTGQKVLDAGQVPNQQPGTDEYQLDLSGLHAGVYLIVARTDRGEALSQRIVVEK